MSCRPVLEPRPQHRFTDYIVQKKSWSISATLNLSSVKTKGVSWPFERLRCD